MTYLVIGDDEQGTLHVRDQFDEMGEFIDRELGVGGSEHAALGRDWQSIGVRAYVNGCSLTMTDRFRRNVIGGCVIATMGARQQPYAGPIVLAGWDYAATAYGELEPRPLRGEVVEGIRSLAGQVRAVVLRDEIPPGCPGPEWAAEIRAYAEVIRTGEVDPVLWVTGDAALDALRRMGP